MKTSVMSKKKMQISIPQPCNEGWENMLPEEKGRFCLTCQKSLIDFSKLSDAQVISILENSKGKVCGRFSETQLNKVLVAENDSSQNRFLKVAGFLLPLFAVNQAYSKSTIIPVQNVQLIKSFQSENSDKEIQQNLPIDSLNVLSILVLDATTGEPIPFVHVLIDETNTPLSTTDMDGKAKFQINSSVKAIRIQSIGYVTFVKEIVVTDFNTEVIIRMNEEVQLIEGDIIFYSPTKPKWWQFKKKKAFKKQLGLEND